MPNESMELETTAIEQMTGQQKSEALFNLYRAVLNREPSHEEIEFFMAAACSEIDFRRTLAFVKTGLSKQILEDAGFNQLAVEFFCQWNDVTPDEACAAALKDAPANS